MTPKIGLAEVDITPPVGSSLLGYFEDRKSTGVHDKLFVQAFLFQAGEEQAALITCDLIALLPETINESKELINREFSIPPGNIFIHSTHTHTGPATAGAFGVVQDIKYAQSLPGLIAGSVRQAVSNLAPGRIGFGSGVENDISFNRRYLMKDGTVRTNPGAGDAWEKIIGKGNPDIIKSTGPIDPEVAVMRIEDESDNLRAVLVNFACHPDTIGGNLISADYPGVIRRLVRKIKGENVLVGFFNGACGNINHLDFWTGKAKTGYFAHTEWLGTILAAEAIKVSEKINCEPFRMVKAGSVKLEIKVRQPEKTELGFARRVIEGDPAKLSEADKVELRLRGNVFGDEIAWLKEMLLVVDEGKKKEEVPVGAARINDAGFAFLPGEVFVEYGLRIKAESKLKHMFVIELTNNSLGYIPTRQAFSEGTGYEERLARSSNLAPEAGDLITEAVLKLLASL
ncbi:MAG: neutral/alkaline non-lysosomal ceramidase N-terminal domain-containing protein [Candidatus Omnitrophica bacterium]|nr:neutral/alkaline non-lysosomal ceramidase N-terminal domain-containing protein [Candidatus Omnitrophota bacterium]